MKRAGRVVVFVAVVFGVVSFSGTSRAGIGISIPMSDSIRLNPVALGAFKLMDGSVHPAGRYTLAMHGSGKPGAVDVRIFDAANREVGRLGGLFKGQCPGAAMKTTFAKLNYSPASEVKIAPQNGGQLVQVLCGRGSRIEFDLPAAPASKR
ncbi:MAG: hypothetical protein NEA02_16070 [Thermoanaerobaculia bacterium]|nr:hypothetical protein [Thermoanaerobaculia bacterium]